eukprot:g2330.t1
MPSRTLTAIANPSNRMKSDSSIKKSVKVKKKKVSTTKVGSKKKKIKSETTGSTSTGVVPLSSDCVLPLPKLPGEPMPCDQWALNKPWQQSRLRTAQEIDYCRQFHQPSSPILNSQPISGNSSSPIAKAVPMAPAVHSLLTRGYHVFKQVLSPELCSWLLHSQEQPPPHHHQRQLVMNGNVSSSSNNTEPYVQHLQTQQYSKNVTKQNTTANRNSQILPSTTIIPTQNRRVLRKRTARQVWRGAIPTILSSLKLRNLNKKDPYKEWTAENHASTSPVKAEAGVKQPRHVTLNADDVHTCLAPIVERSHGRFDFPLPQSLVRTSNVVNCLEKPGGPAEIARYMITGNVPAERRFDFLNSDSDQGKKKTAMVMKTEDKKTKTKMGGRRGPGYTTHNIMMSCGGSARQPCHVDSKWPKERKSDTRFFEMKREVMEQKLQAYQRAKTFHESNTSNCTLSDLASTAVNVSYPCTTERATKKRRGGKIIGNATKNDSSSSSSHLTPSLAGSSKKKRSRNRGLYTKDVLIANLIKRWKEDNPRKRIISQKKTLIFPLSFYRRVGARDLTYEARVRIELVRKQERSSSKSKAKKKNVTKKVGKVKSSEKKKKENRKRKRGEDNTSTTTTSYDHQCYFEYLQEKKENIETEEDDDEKGQENCTEGDSKDSKMWRTFLSPSALALFLCRLETPDHKSANGWKRLRFSDTNERLGDLAKEEGRQGIDNTEEKEEASNGKTKSSKTVKVKEEEPAEHSTPPLVPHRRGEALDSPLRPKNLHDPVPRYYTMLIPLTKPTPK